MVKTNIQENNFKGIYPFATESVAKYFAKLNMYEKDVLTVGSSLDQAFNALILGANKVVVYDINPNVEDFFKYKRDLILTTPREQLYYKVLENADNFNLSHDFHDCDSVINMNFYLQTDGFYERLREKLQTTNIEFVTGDIFNMEDVIDPDKNKFDRIILSNILQYVGLNAGGRNHYEFIAENFNKWKKYLSDDGILQLLYLYFYNENYLTKTDFPNASYNVSRVIREIDDKGFELITFDNFDKKINKVDSIVTYSKRRGR